MQPAVARRCTATKRSTRMSRLCPWFGRVRSPGWGYTTPTALSRCCANFVSSGVSRCARSSVDGRFLDGGRHYRPIKLILLLTAVDTISSWSTRCIVSRHHHGRSKSMGRQYYFLLFWTQARARRGVVCCRGIRRLEANRP